MGLERRPTCEYPVTVFALDDMNLEIMGLQRFRRPIDIWAAGTFDVVGSLIVLGYSIKCSEGAITVETRKVVQVLIMLLQSFRVWKVSLAIMTEREMTCHRGVETGSRADRPVFNTVSLLFKILSKLTDLNNDR